VYDVAKLLRERYPHAEFNIEGNPFHRYMDYARQFRPTQCTLVPDTPEAATSDQGWDLPRDIERLRPVVAELKKIQVAGEAIRSLGMRFNAGHALNYFNVQPVARLPVRGPALRLAR